MTRLLLLVLILVGACRDRVDRDERKKATGLAGAPLPSSSPAEPGCPAGTDLAGAPRPRGSGMWCQKVADGRLEIFRLDGTLWARGAVDAKGMQGPVTFFAPGGQIAMVRTYADNNSQGEDDIRLPGIELPPTVMPVCARDMTIAPTTSPCP